MTADPAAPQTPAPVDIRQSGAPSRAVPPLVVDSVTKTYATRGRRRNTVTAVDDVSFTIAPGAAMALVGASGSGKSTLAKMITGSERPSSGSIRFGDLEVGSLRTRALRDYHRSVQM